MKRIYLDNAASTALDNEVLSAMLPYMMEEFGNPSSTHWYGRRVRAAVELSRKQIAELLNCSPGEIFFTSGGTEADNAIIIKSVQAFGIKHAITTPIEHHAVGHTLEMLAHTGTLIVHHVKLDEKGHVDFNDLEKLLQCCPNALLCLMHGNNEIGNLLDIHRAGELAKHYNAFFHSDTVQTMGHYSHDLQEIHVCGLAAGGHKFHGPMGAGFMYLRKDRKIGQLIYGGSQERNMRGGTENSQGIIGLAKAVEIAYRDMSKHEIHIRQLKSRMIAKLKESIPVVSFNGDSANLERSLYTVLNVSLPESEENSMLLLGLDLQGIAASGGSACSSGSGGSHVLEALYPASPRAAVRFSFSKLNTEEEIDIAVNKLAMIVRAKVMS